ncbi:hypothetical protein [Rarobacter faecitabidus]
MFDWSLLITAGLGVAGIGGTWTTARSARLSSEKMDEVRRRTEQSRILRQEKTNLYLEVLAEVNAVLESARFLSIQDRVLREHRLVHNGPDPDENRELDAAAYSDARDKFIGPHRFDLRTRTDEIARLSAKATLMLGKSVHPVVQGALQNASHTLLSCFNCIEHGSEIKEDGITTLRALKELADLASRFDLDNPEATVGDFRQYLHASGFDPSTLPL